MQWPRGWEISHLPTPNLSSGKNLGGERVRAIRMQEGHPAAVIELSYYPRNDGGQANLDEELEGVVRGVSEGFKAMGMTVNVERKTGTLGSLPDREVTITASLGEVSLRQQVAMAFSKDFIYSLNFSGLDAEVKKSQADFDATRRSLVVR
jgi:hypothetical protein